MNLPTKFIVIALITFSLLSCSKESMDNQLEVPTADAIIPEDKVIELEILELINAYRITNGLSVLNNLPIVKSQAYTHTNYMIEINDINHDHFSIRRAYLVSKAGANKVSENVAYGYSSAQSVVNAWIASDSHRSAIEGDYTDFNISAEKNENGSWYFTNIFIKR